MPLKVIEQIFPTLSNLSTLTLLSPGLYLTTPYGCQLGVFESTVLRRWELSNKVCSDLPRLQIETGYRPTLFTTKIRV